MSKYNDVPYEESPLFEHESIECPYFKDTDWDIEDPRYDVEYKTITKGENNERSN